MTGVVRDNSSSRVRTILVLGYWVLGNIHRYWVVLSLLIGGDFLLFWHPIQYQSESSQWYLQILDSIVFARILFSSWRPIRYRSDSSRHCPDASDWLFSSTCDLFSDRCNYLSGHHADMLLFIKHIVIIVEYQYWYWVLVSLDANIIGYWILGAFLGIILTLSSSSSSSCC